MVVQATRVDKLGLVTLAWPKVGDIHSKVEDTLSKEAVTPNKVEDTPRMVMLDTHKEVVIIKVVTNNTQAIKAVTILTSNSTRKEIPAVL